MHRMNSKGTRHFSSLIKATFLGLIYLGISACSTAPLNSHPATLSPAHAYAPFAYKQMELEKLVQWDVKGKLAAYRNGKNNAGLMTWRQRPEQFDLLINGPLGSGQLHLEATPGFVVATSSKGRVEASTIEALFEQEFGWQFPMQELRYWARGIPKPNTLAKISYNSQGDAATIEQAGWHVTYHSYNKISHLSYDQAIQLPMPKKIELIGTDIRLVLILKSWSNLYPFPRPNLSLSQSPNLNLSPSPNPNPSPDTNTQ